MGEIDVALISYKGWCAMKLNQTKSKPKIKQKPVLLLDID